MIRTKGERAFNVVNIILLALIAFVCLYPMYYLLVFSLNEGRDSNLGGLYFWPRAFTLENYAKLLSTDSIRSAYLVTIARTIIGSIGATAFTALVAYGMVYKRLYFRRFYNVIFIIPMFFGGGIIPYYILIRDIGLYNNPLVYVIPSLFAGMNFVMLRTYFTTLPESLEESAKIDGAGEFRIFLRIVVPVSVPILAAILLFNAVGHWNSWFDAYIFMENKNFYTLQLELKNLISQQITVEQMLLQGKFEGGMHAINSIEKIVQQSGVTSRSLQAAASIVVIGPIVLVYPFLQKYFMKGIMVGSLKG